MAKVFETQTIIVDPFASPIVNVNLNKAFDLLEAAILTNTVLPRGKREITLGLVYDDAVVAQHSLSIEPILVGKNIADVTNIPISDIQTIQFTEFIESSISGDTMRLSILTLSIVGAQVNSVSTQNVELDPSNPITVVGLPVSVVGTELESHLCNVGSLDSTGKAQGTVNSVAIVVSQA